MHYEWTDDGYGYGGESLWEKGVFGIDHGPGLPE